MPLPFKNGDRILFQGDSITDCGCRDPRNVDPLGTGYVAMVRGMLSARQPELKVTVLNRGRSGDRTADLLPRWEEDVKPLRPTWLSLMIGVNDVWRLRKQADGGARHIPLDEFKRNYALLLDQARGFGIGKFVLMAPTTIDDDPESDLNQMLAGYDAAVKDFATTYGAIYVPARDAMWRAIHAVPTVRWTSDGCHPTVAGHALLASLWLSTVSGE